MVTQGGTLYLCNHPGVADSLALFAHLNRGDVHILVNDHWFFHSFKSFRKSFLFVDRNNSSPLVIRRILNQLKSGHGVVLYPAGTIEPDPGLGNSEGSVFQNWSKVVGLLCGISQKQGWGFQVQTILTRGIFKGQDANRPWIPSGLDVVKSSAYTIPEILFLGLAKRRTIDLIILPPVESKFFFNPVSQLS
jgi:1-acyl-sn-glycerol-3-phosphate acyltransferase